MTTRKTSRRERCAAGRHTPLRAPPAAEPVRHATCRYCGRPIMRTQATRIWFEAGVMGEPGRTPAAAGSPLRA